MATFRSISVGVETNCWIHDARRHLFHIIFFFFDARLIINSHRSKNVHDVDIVPTAVPQPRTVLHEDLDIRLFTKSCAGGIRM